MRPRMVVALNMFDELQDSSAKLITTVWAACWACRWFP